MKDAGKWLLGLGAVAMLAAVASRMPWPVPFLAITSPFGDRGGTFHNGVDLRAAVGTPIVAPRAGKVVESGYNGSGGNYLVVLLSNGKRMGLAHMRDWSQLGAGDVFAAGRVLGYTGDTGNVTGPHLHLTLKDGDVWLDPEKYFA